jgi:hypothetical protein
MRAKQIKFSYPIIFLRMLLPFFKDRRLQEISRATDQVGQGPSRHRGQTFNLDRETLSMIFKYAKKLKIFHAENPVDGIKKRKVIKAVIVPPTREQFTAILEVMRRNKQDRTKEAPPFIAPLSYSFAA